MTQETYTWLNTKPEKLGTILDTLNFKGNILYSSGIMVTMLLS